MAENSNSHLVLMSKWQLPRKNNTAPKGKESSVLTQNVAQIIKNKEIEDIQKPQLQGSQKLVSVRNLQMNFPQKQI